MSRQILLVALVAAALAGCGGDSATLPTDTSPSTVPGGNSPTGANGNRPGGGADTRPIGGGGGLTVDRIPIETETGLPLSLVVYFQFDQSGIDPEFNELLAAHGEFLASNGGVQVRLEGHTDERGTREYNIGLGEQRAQAVRRVLLLQGAATGQLSTVSYGEERPAAVGSEDEAYGLNRRVELVYRR
jgi:peptidoglycan-associated lipoprotein